jgi:hypothetical protein
MKLIARLKLDKETFLKYEKKGVRYFLYNEITFDTKELENQNIVFYNCSQDRVESTWFTWKENEKIITKYLERFPNAFTFEKYDFTLALKKALYWSNQKSGFIEYARTTNFPSVSVKETTSLHNYNRSKIIIKTLVSTFIKKLVATKKKDTDKISNHKGCIGVFIKHVFQLQLYKHIVAETKNNNSFVFFVIDTAVLKGLESLGVEQNRIVLINKHENSVIATFLKTKKLLKLKNEDWYIWNQLLLQEQEFETWINLGLGIVETGISKLLMNEGENGIMGAVLGEIMTKNNIQTYNTMNGMKSGQAQDYFINFDKWFVWDEQMKALLMKGNYLPESKFIVSGHLMEDEASNHVFQNSLNIEKVKYQNKRIISLFSIRGNREEKTETIKFFEEYLTANKDVFLIIRPHPSEVNNATFGNLETFDNCFIVNYTSSNSKITLYDQMLISEISICFGSTVALESKWFGVPCISFEKREKSLIYLIDNITIRLVHSVKELSIEITVKKDRSDFANRENVAKAIIKNVF